MRVESKLPDAGRRAPDATDAAGRYALWEVYKTVVPVCGRAQSRPFSLVVGSRG